MTKKARYHSFRSVNTDTFEAIIKGEQKAILSIGFHQPGDYFKLVEFSEGDLAPTGRTALVMVTHYQCVKDGPHSIAGVYSVDIKRVNEIWL
ncbi:hypothetical protein [Kluyvera cryocrescens]|uniref:hypothetical protein n=1 Tax=Kluyvera cryocrescens TaxID=580 RepID=UPI000D9162E3|nr:hypothetical protein [Kluyvera cryocrescens]SQC32569.1 Uncharacterised protein [Kluyvera cryocrescens]